jgi:serine/threonine protein kinase
MLSPRWIAVSESAYAWEAEAITFLRDRLPDSAAYRGWSNFEFVSQDGFVNEIDALVLTPSRLVLVEIKSQPGIVSGDLGQWTWRWPDGRLQVVDNPLLLANRKAKRLAGLLASTRALKGKRTPYVEAAIFLSNRDVGCELSGPAGTRVFTRGGKDPERGVIRFLDSLGDPGHPGRMDLPQQRAVLRALEELNLRPVQREFTVGQWKLTSLLDDAGVYQDFLGTHARASGSTRRIRVYPWPATGPETGRKARKQAALREFQFLDRPDQHPGLLRAFSLEDTERGPAIVFENPEGAERLDAFLLRRGAQLELRQRLRLLRELADALAWAHGQGLYHRTLTPHAVLVSHPDENAPGVKLFNWQVGTLAETTAPGGTLTWHDFLQVGLGGRDANAVYLAPELRGGGRPDPALLDVFSLGTLAYHLLTGNPPASSQEELLPRLRESRGLRLSAALDGVDPDLDALIQLATSPDLADRPTADDFRAEVERVMATVAAQAEPPEPGRWVHPLDAEQGAELEGGFVVQRRLGSGSTALALVVQRSGRAGVLKVAREVELNDRLRQEGEILRQLRHQHVVELLEVAEVSGHVALFMEQAGEQTLAHRLRQEGALTLELLQRFGEELLTVVDWLEQKGVPHRDLKPENIGVGETHSGKRTLLLFDFSLSATPADNIRAGTPGYLDPFLEERKPRRWDTAAERYSAAVTLHEMATGSLPQWGDGRQHPATLPAEAEPVLARERFDPSIREEMERFFLRALARDPRKRFDTAEAMRAAWRDLFRDIDRPSTAPVTSTDAGPIDAIKAVQAADPSAPLAVLGIPPRVLNALERLGVHHVSALAELPRTQLYGNPGIGLRTVREIRDLADAAARALAERGLADPALVGLGVEAPGLEAVDPSVDPALWSVDLLLRELASSRLPSPEPQVLRLLSGLDAPVDAEGPDVWPGQRDVAEALGISRSSVAETVERARTRWLKKKPVNLLRDEVARLLAAHGGLATREELAQALLSARGSAEASAAERLRRAGAVLWGALELEGTREISSRYRLQRGERLLLVVSSPEGADPAAVRSWVEALGARADELAREDPPLSPQRTLEELIAVEAPVGLGPLAPERLLRLAVSASARAAVTPRQELYLRGLPAERAVALGAGALLGASALSVEQVRLRIAARFPAAAELPGRPALDRLLEAAGVPLMWDDNEGKYIPPPVRGSVTLSGTSTRHLGPAAPPAAVDEAEEEAEELERRLSALVAEGRFLALTADPGRLGAVETRLLERFGLERVSLERLLLDAMREQADLLGVQWPVVLEADGPEAPDRARRNLLTLVQKARPAVERALASLDRPTLLAHPGLLARYGLLPLLQPLQDRARRGPGVIVLIPDYEQNALPQVDDVVLPVVHPSDWARVPRGWHRRGARASS